MRKLTFGQQLDRLAETLAKEVTQRATLPLQRQIILVPPGGMRSWLLVELAKREIVAGCQVLTVGEWVRSLGAPIATFFELASAILTELKKSSDEELKQYFSEKETKRMELAEHLAHLFEIYGEYAPQFFSSEENWQRKLFKTVFIEGAFRAPVQIFPEIVVPNVPIYCFGIDFLPPCYWELLCRAQHLSVYLFSPCSHFWEDICSDWERRKLLRYGRKKGVSKEELGQLEEYLQEAPTLLANWGKLSRQTLKELDRFEFEAQEEYGPCKAALHSILRRVQELLFAFEKPTKEKWKEDHSIKIFQTGSSKFCEVEKLCEEILRLGEEGVPFSEMTVLTPDLESYAPLIELLFSQFEIPYRMVGAGMKSLFIQGLKRLLGVLGGEEELEELFEAPAFSRKMGWESFEKIRQWTSIAKRHGVEALLKGLTELAPKQSLRIEMCDAELLEGFVEAFQILSEKKGEKTLGEWASFLEEMVEKFLVCEEEDWEFFGKFLKEFRRAHKMVGEETFPIVWVGRFLNQPISSEIHATHLHAVKIAPFTEGNITVQKALFLVGMDEENFPKANMGSSLDLLKKEPIYLPEQRDRDRYLFLRALFSATEFLRISYGHLSREEGKSIGPSSVVEELLQFINTCYEEPPKLICSFKHRLQAKPKQKIPWEFVPSKEIPEGEKVISINDLSNLARHPWKFYLRKKWGIFLESREEASLALQKAILLRESLENPIEEVLEQSELPAGILKEAISREVKEKAEEWKGQIEKPLFTVAFLESCREMQWVDPTRVELPCLKISLGEKTQVRIVGEIKNVSKEMLVVAGDDSLSGLLKAWPEWLCVSTGLGVSKILCLKSKKTKVLTDASKWLEKFLIYFFAAQEALSPLLPDWVDFLLRDGKKKRSPFQDQVVEWVMARGEFPKTFEAEWKGFLRETFEGLIHAKI